MEKFEVDLDNSQKLDLMDLLTSDVAKGDAYLAIEGKDCARNGLHAVFVRLCSSIQ